MVTSYWVELSWWEISDGFNVLKTTYVGAALNHQPVSVRFYSS